MVGGPKAVAALEARASARSPLCSDRRCPHFRETPEGGATMRSRLISRCRYRWTDSWPARRARLDWVFKSWDDDVTAWTMETLRETGVHIMGSRTFHDMSAYWPKSTEPFAAPMNQIPKVVFSTRGASCGRQPGTHARARRRPRSPCIAARRRRGRRARELGECPGCQRRHRRRDRPAQEGDRQGRRRPRRGALRAAPRRARPRGRISPAGSPDRAGERTSAVLKGGEAARPSSGGSEAVRRRRRGARLSASEPVRCRDGRPGPRPRR